MTREARPSSSPVTSSAVAISERHPLWAHTHFCVQQRRDLAALSVTWMLLGSWFAIAVATLWGMACTERLHRATAVRAPFAPQSAMVFVDSDWHPPLCGQWASHGGGLGHATR